VTVHLQTNSPLLFPPLASTSPLLHNQHPGGVGSFWFVGPGGHMCQYVPSSVTPCFTVVRPGASHGGVVPALAAELARRLVLMAGSIETSPRRVGLTGAESWFWLEPAARRQTLSLSLGGETVTVIADPTVVWHFGDGVMLDGGAGVPYRRGAPSAEAIRHDYQTRCLPGDQGHDPYVLSSCGQDGYTVGALVVWRISYSATGRVVASGTLPMRTTESSRSYPVRESRAFLVSGGSQ
jgi:hypothetical protein